VRDVKVDVVAMEPIAVTVAEAGRLLGIKKSEAYELVARGVIPSVRLGPRCTRVPVDALRERMNALAIEEAETA